MIEYIVKRAGGTALARVTQEGGASADLLRAPGGTFKLISGRKESWELDPRVMGEIRPFSMGAAAVGGGAKSLTILNHLFFHDRVAYMLTGVPEHMHPAEHTLGERYVNRLETFPFSSLEEVDRETWGRLRSHRGKAVGKIEAVSEDGLKLELPEELEEVGMPLAAASYLIYSAG